ncbi:unnamed protein product, partial [Linum tenue]
LVLFVFGFRIWTRRRRKQWGRQEDEGDHQLRPGRGEIDDSLGLKKLGDIPLNLDLFCSIGC